MAMTFDEFVNNLDELEINQSNWANKKEIWLNSLDKLYMAIKDYLKPYESKIKIDEQEILINEEYIGEYPAKKLSIQLGKDTVTLTPKGTNLIGASGRVDMNSSHGTIKLVLIEQDEKRLDIANNTKNDPNSLVWTIAQQQPRLVFFELNQESFQDALMELVNA